MASLREAQSLRLQPKRSGSPLLQDSAKATQSGRSTSGLRAQAAAAHIRYSSLTTAQSSTRSSSISILPPGTPLMHGACPTLESSPLNDADRSFNGSRLSNDPTFLSPDRSTEKRSSSLIDTVLSEIKDESEASNVKSTDSDLIELSSASGKSITPSMENKDSAPTSTSVARDNNDTTVTQSKSRSSDDTGSTSDNSRRSNGIMGHSKNIASFAPFKARPQRGSGSPPAASQEMTQAGSASSPLLGKLLPYDISKFGQDLTRYHYYDLKSPPGSTTDLVSPFKGRNSGALPTTPRMEARNPFTSASEVELNRPPTNSPAVRSFSPFLGNNLMTSSGQYKFAMFMDEREDDDDMHTPGEGDEDTGLKPSLRRMCCGGPRAVIHMIGLGLFVVGLLFLFIGWPIMSKASNNQSVAPPLYPEPTGWDHVNDVLYPLLQNVRQGLIDPDTPESAYTRTSVDGEDLQLVFSDEFNVEGRTFYPEDDSYWYAPDLWYAATQDLEWYSPDAVTTKGGALELRMDRFPNHNLNFRSGMLNSWNQLCFKGGHLEVSVSLPGPGGIMGLWPGVWTLGNLARPGYLATSEGTWPYTYDGCDSGITPNQSMTDGTSKLPGQKLSSCTCSGEDHPTPGTGRGAPEIDIFEASSDWSARHLGVATQSLQVAPFDIWWYPNYDFTAYPDQTIAYPNSWTGGPFQEALSGTAMLNNKWYDGIEYQKYAFEYTPGYGEDGKLAWLIGDQITWNLDGRAIGPNGNIGARAIPEEPMSIVMNLGISNSWASIDWDNLRFPTTMRIDYVRLYQDPDNVLVTCDPPGYETTEYIKNHAVAYTNNNLTKWKDTGYDWPRNDFMHGC